MAKRGVSNETGFCPISGAYGTKVPRSAATAEHWWVWWGEEGLWDTHRATVAPLPNLLWGQKH